MTAAELERAAAGCLLPGFVGLEPPRWLREWLDRGLGGVCLFARNVRDVDQLAVLTEVLRDGRDDVVVGVDEEGGDVTRLELSSGSSYPGAWALGVVDDEALTERVAAAIGGDLARAGVNLDFAPVADVNTNPDNPIIGIRSFGAGAGLVARHVAAFVTGLQGAGVAACAKHFPGHGDTRQDSHHELPTIEPDAKAFEAALLPFRAAVDAGVRAVMTAHIRVPALDDAPATLSRALLDGVLRGELGFGGAVVTDALEMRGVSETIGVEEAAVRSLDAGADALLLGHDLGPDALEQVHAAVVTAVQSGRIEAVRLADAAARTAALGRPTEGARPDGADRTVGAEAARRALLVEGEILLGSSPLVVELAPLPTVAAGPAQHGFGAVLQGRLPHAEVVTVSGPNGLPEISGRQVVLVLRDAHRHAWERDVAERLLTGVRHAIVVETGLPFWRPAAAGFLATHGAGRVNYEAAVERLLAP
jgi:beta-N-acetylhexosaminidase